MPLPKFHSDEEAADYFETHSVADPWNRLPDAKPTNSSKALAKSIRERRAAAKSVGYQTQLRLWISDGVRREAKRA